MRSASAAVIAAWLVTAARGAEPVVDAGRFIQAISVRDDAAVVFVYRHQRYRRATGLAAWPDGGTPIYLDDEHVVRVVDRDGAHPRVLWREKDPWVAGGGSVHVDWDPVDPARVLVTSSGQRRSDLLPARTRLWLRLADGTTQDYPDLANELAAQGLRSGHAEFGEARALDDRGTLLVAGEDPREADGPAWMLLRTADGKLARLDRIAHFYGALGHEIFYWTAANDGVVLDWTTGARRLTNRWDDAAHVNRVLIPHDPTVEAIQRAAAARATHGVRVADDGGHLDALELVGDAWKPTAIPLDVRALSP